MGPMKKKEGSVWLSLTRLREGGVMRFSDKSDPNNARKPPTWGKTVKERLLSSSRDGTVTRLWWEAAESSVITPWSLSIPLVGWGG